MLGRIGSRTVYVRLIQIKRAVPMFILTQCNSMAHSCTEKAASGFSYTIILANRINSLVLNLFMGFMVT